MANDLLSPPAFVSARDLVARWAARTPGATAVSFGRDSLTYAQLDEHARSLGRVLRARGVQRDVVVGVCLERSIDAVVALLAIHAAGGAYLPLDPEYPGIRLAAMIEEADAPLVITRSPLAHLFASSTVRLLTLDDAATECTPSDDDLRLEADALAYVIFTSGSSGAPRGVMIEQGSLRGLVDGVIGAYGITAKDRVLQFTSLSFDISIEEILSTLAAGATLVLRTEEMLESISGFLRHCADERISVLNLPTAFWHEMADVVHARGLTLPESLRLVIIGGERAHAGRVARWVESATGHVRLINGYGPTEATITATTCDLSATRFTTDVPIGRPIAGVTAHIVADELYLTGASLARGYCGDDVATRERFVSVATSNGPVRAYRTGDRVRLRPDGQLEFLGRLDAQLKVRGYRVEPAEIEVALETLPEVAEAAVMPSVSESGVTRLIAFVRPASDASLLDDSFAGALRASLEKTLPRYLIPALFVPLKAWPVTTQGKIDRAALLALPIRPAKTTDESKAGSETERALARMWHELLEVDHVSLGDDFFDLGGHSLLAMQLVARIEDELGVPIPVHALFTARTPASLAVLVDAKRAVPVDVSISSPEHGREPVLSIEQEAWLMRERWERLHGVKRKAFHIHSVCRLAGPLDERALAGALSEVVRRHEALRTTFTTIPGVMTSDALAPIARAWLSIPGMVQQVYRAITKRPLTRRPSRIVGDIRPVIGPATPIALPIVDLRHIALEQRETEAMRVLGGEYERGLDWQTGPMLRALLVRTGDQDYVLSVLMHHLAADGWSIDVLLDEIGVLYRAIIERRASPLAELTWQFRDFAWWQREWLGAEVTRTLPHWHEHFAKIGLFPELGLPFARQGRLGKEHYVRGRRFTHALSPSLTSGARTLGRRTGATLFAVMLTALQALVHRYTGRADFGILAPMANRNRPEARRLIGWVDNVCVLIAHVDETVSFLDLLQQAKREVVEALAYQEIPYSLVHLMLLPHQPSYRMTAAAVDAPFIYFDVRPRARPAQQMPGVTMTPVEVPDTAVNSGVELVVIEHTDHLELNIQYSLDRFEPLAIAEMMAQYALVLERVVARPEESLSTLLSVISPPTRQP
ncbi:MAG: amino acid adenylation domain-containing protein [Gemmatimonadota bacterium]|nr:amino acid adenylation domain-containing protein [Gemmatimonadota bacterium]